VTPADVAWGDYVTALGQEFCGVIDPDGVHDVMPMDAAAAVIDCLGDAGASPAALQALTPAGCAALARHLSSDLDVAVAVAAVDMAIARLLRRWPAAG
jgi:hypothetical protein